MHKKVSREQASLSVDNQTGAVALTVLGKNGMLWRPSEDAPFAPLGQDQTVALGHLSEFSLLARLEGAPLPSRVQQQGINAGQIIK